MVPRWPWKVLRRYRIPYYRSKGCGGRWTRHGLGRCSNATEYAASAPLVLKRYRIRCFRSSGVQTLQNTVLPLLWCSSATECGASAPLVLKRYRIRCFRSSGVQTLQNTLLPLLWCSNATEYGASAPWGQAVRELGASIIRARMLQKAVGSGRVQNCNFMYWSSKGICSVLDPPVF